LTNVFDGLFKKLGRPRLKTIADWVVPGTTIAMAPGVEIGKILIAARAGFSPSLSEAVLPNLSASLLNK
jgi:hypothetical protein